MPRTLTIKSEENLLHEATGYIYYYNNLREHSALGYQPPYQYLKQQLPPPLAGMTTSATSSPFS